MDGENGAFEVVDIQSYTNIISRALFLRARAVLQIILQAPVWHAPVLTRLVHAKRPSPRSVMSSYF